MAAKNHLSPQFVRLYRGLHATSPEHIEHYPTGIGPHWSANPEIAYNFATYRDISGVPHWNAGDDDIPLAGTVVEALIHKRHIIDPDSEEGWEWALENVFPPEHSEQERTVRYGAPIHIQNMYYFSEDPKQETTVKPLRKKGYRA